MEIPGEEEDDNISPDLLRGFLKKKRKFKREEVALLLGYDLEDEDDAECVDELLGFLKGQKYRGYKKFKDTPKAKVTALADSAETIACGTQEDIKELHSVLNKKLPPLPPNASKRGGAGTQSVHPILRGIPASQQVSTDPVKMRQAKDAFYESVTDVGTIVEDAYILRAFLIAKGKQTYITNSDDKKWLEDVVAPGLAEKVNGCLYRSIKNQEGATVRARKVARMDETLLNQDGTAFEDARSGNFVGAWNHNLLSKYNVQARAQFPAHKAGNSTKKADVVLDHGGKAKANGFRDSLDFVSVMEWKNNYMDGADREGAVYSLLIQEGINRKRFLVFSVAPGLVEVFGIYWKEADTKARRVKLAEYTSAAIFFQEWLQAIMYFACESESDVHTPAIPAFDATATKSAVLTHNVFKVEIKETTGEAKPYVYKVYDYLNRQGIPLADRRWLNWDIVKKCYPAPELVVDLPSFKIFRYPFQDSGEGDIDLKQHVPPSIKSFKAIGEDLEKRHSEGWIVGDVRLANMLFIGDKAYMIDMDFARKVGSGAKYPPGYTTERLPRHPNAVAGAPMEQCHDVHSFWRCFQILSGTGVDCPGKKMSDIMDQIHMDDYVRPSPNEIDELSMKTGSPARS